MGNFTSVTLVAKQPAPAGGDGAFWAFGTAVGPASYDANGSELDMSAIFKSKVYGGFAYVDNADVRCIFVPASAYATATAKLFLDDNAGTELTGDQSTTCAVIHWTLLGTDA